MKNKRVDGKAGVGKTRKLIFDAMTLSEDHDAKVLIVVFNKRLERELSAKIFDDNITVTTFHSIAYRAMKVNKIDYPTSYGYVKKFIPSLNTIEATVLVKLFSMYNQSNSNSIDFAERIFATKYIRDYAQTIRGLSSPKVLSNIIDTITNSYVQSGNHTHDTYVKEYQMSNPSTNYDHIIIDEYMDYSEVMIDAIKSYNKPTWIYGDKDQRIYSFKFATGEFPFKFDEVEQLFETKRCPSNITNLANSFLGILGDQQMTSNVPDGKIYSYENFPTITEDTTFLSNWNLIAIEAIMYYGFKVNFDIHIDIKMEKLKEMWDFVNKRPETPAWMKKFPSLDHLIKFYQETENVAGLTLIKCALIIPNWDKFNDMLDHFDENQPTLSVTNVFISKGLEWDNVIIARDFTDLESTSYKKLTYDPVRFLYTAITRCKKKLWIPVYLNKLVIKPICEFLPDTSDLIAQKENELISRASKVKNDNNNNDRYSDWEINPNSGEVKSNRSSGLNIGKISVFSGDDIGLGFAKQMDEANKRNGVNDVNGGGTDANVNRYLESKIFDIPLRDLELRDKSETYFLNDRDIAEIGMRAFGV